MPSNVLAVVAGVLFFSLVLWGAALQRWWAGKPLIPAISHTPAPWGLVDLALAAGIWLSINLVAAAIGLANGPIDAANLEAQKPLLLIGSIATLVICLLIAAALWIRHRVTSRELGWDAPHFVGDVVLGCKAFVMLAPIVYGLQSLLTQVIDSKHPLIELLIENPDPKFFAIALFAAVLVAPLAEEFLFRVLLQGWLERMFARDREHTDLLVFGGRPASKQLSGKDPGTHDGQQHDGQQHDGQQPNSQTESTDIHPSNSYSHPTANEYDRPAAELLGNADLAPSRESPPRPTAIILSSLFFALSHWSHGPDPIPLFVFALGLGYLFQRTNRIAPCIILHFLLNLCTLGALWLTVAA